MKYRILTIGILLFIYLNLIQYNRIFIVVILCFIYLIFYRDLYVLIIILFLLLNVADSTVYQYKEGYITDIKSNSIIVSKEGERILITCDTQPFNYYNYISFDTSPTLIENDSSLYGFDYKNYLNNQNIYSSIYQPKIIIIDRVFSIKGVVYDYIKKLDDGIIKKFYLKFFYKINSFVEDDLFMQIGLPYYGLIALISGILKYFFKNNTIFFIRIIMLVSLGFLFGFNFIIYRLLISSIVMRLIDDKIIRFNVNSILLMVMFPGIVNSVSFIYPIAFLFLGCFSNTKYKAYNYLVSSIIQGLFFLKVNIVTVFFYKYLVKWYGLIMFLLLVSLINPGLFEGIFVIIIEIQSVLESSFNYIIGKPNLIVFVILFMLFSLKLDRRIILIIYLLVMNFNLYRLNYEISFINIGQGDSILITSPFNHEVVLIDTGKEKEYSKLNSYLIGSGVKQIDYLIISHNDEDHNGSLDRLLIDYNVIHTITSASDINVMNTKLYSLNKEAKGADNNDSLVYYFNLGKLNFFFAGDIDSSIEQKLIDEYDLEVDILKVSHHGSKSSTSLGFIDSIMPSLAIISTNGQYHHPHSQVTSVLEKTKTAYRITKNSGDIRIIVNKIFNLMHTSSQEFAIIKK